MAIFRLLRRAPLTTVLLAAIGLAFLAEVLYGGSTDLAVLVALGANIRPLHGEYWRWLSSMFLHIGPLHLLVNAWALLQLCGIYEIWVGAGRLALVYFASGLAGSAASSLLTLADPQQVSAGASGAIFGVLGAMVAFLLRRRDRLNPQARSLLGQLLFWAGLNVVLGFTVPGIDNAAHLGGALTGFLVGLAQREKRRYRLPPAGELG